MVLDLMSSSEVQAAMIKCCSSLQSDNRCTALHASLLATSTCTPIMTIAKNHGLHPDMMFTLHAVV